GRAEPRADQAEIEAERAGTAAEEIAAADIGKQADAGLRHGEHRVFGGDAMAAIDRNPDAAAHVDAVHERDVWFRETVQPRVEPVFGAIESARIIARALVVKLADIAAGAEGAAALPAHQHAAHRAF